MAVVVCALWAAVSAQPAGIAVRLERAGQFDAAWREYRLAVERAPKDAAAFRGYARLSLQLGRADSLVALSRRLQAADPNNALFALGLAEGLLGLKRRAEALAEVRLAARRWPEQTVNLVEVLKQSKEYAAAVELLEGRMAQTGFRDDLALKLVELHELDQQYAAAARVLVELVNRDGRAASGQSARLRLYGRRGAARQVVSELSAIEEQTLRDEAQAQVQLGAGNQPLAVQLMKRSHSPQELYDFGRECERDGFLEAALAVYRETGTGTDLARVLRRLGRVAEARQMLAGESSPAALLELGELFREGRDFEAAAGAYRRLLAVQPRNAQALEGLAAAELGLGRLDSAQRVLARLEPDNDRSLFLAAKVSFYRGEFDSARAKVEELIRKFPQSRLVNDGLELVLLCQDGERAKALAEAMLDYEAGLDQAGLRRAAELSRGSDVAAEQALLLQAAFLRRAGRPREALAVLDSALARPEPRELRGRTMLERAFVFRDDLHDTHRFQLALEELIQALPASPYTPLARSLLAEAAAPVPGGGVR
ncbi:MAG: hypothetical protein ABIK37_00980 [candidate division WOR-3 bacterium]